MISNSEIKLVHANIKDAPIIQRMWPFFVYDLSRYCGFLENWECPSSPDFKPDDLSSYFTDPKKAFLIQMKNEWAGFVLISQLECMSEVDFYLSEFFIFGKFQNHGIGKKIAFDLFNLLKGNWAIGVLPENKAALSFWRKTISEYTRGDFSESLKTKQELITTEHPDPYPMIVFSFVTLPR